MFNKALTLLVALVFASTAHAHFIFVVPEPSGVKAKVIMSEDLTPDPDVKIDIIAGTKLSLLTAAGDVSPVKLDNKVEAAFLIDLPGSGTRVVFGSAVLGVRAKGDTKPYLLAYYPKTIVGDAFDPKATLAEKSPVELIPVNEGGKLRLKFVAAGKPVQGAEINLVLIDGSVKKPTTDKDGLIDAVEVKGRIGAWTKVIEPAAGEHNGQKYEEVRRYAMLVIDADALAKTVKAAPTRIPSHGMSLANSPQTPEKLDAVKYPTQLPIATSSFGAALLDGHLYYYGGHISRTHSYSVEAVTGQFARLNLADKSAKWETLPGGPGLQGMNLLAHGGKIYRIGGMAPRNFPGTKHELHSVADVVRFDPATKTWENLTPLPEVRSSHDMVAVGDTIYVVGGWSMNGKSGNTWVETTLALDLKAAKPQWKPIPQPFVRRALIASVHEGKVYVIGGLDEDSETCKNVEILDPATNTWSTGPELPGKPVNGFSPAACVLGGRLYVSVADGTMYVLSVDRKSWEKVGVATPRIVHRLIPSGGDILIVGGAMRGENMDLIESMPIGQARPAAGKIPAAAE